VHFTRAAAAFARITRWTQGSSFSSSSSSSICTTNSTTTTIVTTAPSPQGDLIRIETSLERNSLEYEVRITSHASAKELLARKFLINEFFTRAGTFRDDIFEQQFENFCAPFAFQKSKSD